MSLFQLKDLFKWFVLNVNLQVLHKPSSIFLYYSVCKTLTKQWITFRAIFEKPEQNANKECICLTIFQKSLRVSH